MRSYDDKYSQKGFYWGKEPSKLCRRVVEVIPTSKDISVLDIGCGEGRDAVFLAAQGYIVTAFDLSIKGIEKTRDMAEEAGVALDVFEADLNEYRLGTAYDVLFSTGCLHFIRPELIDQVIANYKSHTSDNGLNAFAVLVEKPFIERAPDADPDAKLWKSGDLLRLYHDWEILYCTEDIFDCNSGGTAHRHAINRVIARKPGEANQ